MKILVVTNLYPPHVLGGYEIGCSQMVRELRSIGHDVVVLTSTRREISENTEEGVERSLTLSLVYEGELMHQVSEEMRTHIRIKAHFLDSENLSVFLRKIGDFQPEIVYFWNLIGIGGWSFIIASQKLALPWVMHLMDNVPGHLCVYSHGIESSLVQMWEKFVFGRYISCSTKLVEEIVMTGPDISLQTSIVPNWLSSVPSSIQDIFSSKPMDAAPVRLVFTGTVARFKGVHIIIEMSKILAERNIAHVIDIYGRIEEQDLVTQTARLALEHHITFHGALPHARLIQKLSKYDIFVFPTWEREPMAFAPIEAMAYGCLALITTVNGNAEWFVHGVHCWKAARTPTDMADAVEFLAQNPELRRRISVLGSQLSRTQLNIKNLGIRVERILAQSIQNSPCEPKIDSTEISRLSVLGSIMEEILFTLPRRLH